MNGALQSMLEGVIDYAGLFPPAKRPLTEAVDDYLGIVHGPDKWIVDRFACPAGKLADLAVELTEHPEEPFVPVAVIGTIQPDHKHWKCGIEHDAAEMTKFQRAVENHAEIQAYEIRVPDHGHLTQYLGDLKAFANVDLFVELPWGSEMADSLSQLAESDSTFAKARTGGADVPTSQDLAALIQQCVQLDLTFKLTAGLHHPLPGVDAQSGARTHGFLNVLTATTMALSGDLSRRELEELLEERSAKGFVFKRESMTWRGHKATLEDIENARTILVSFGSCSVEEPLEGLQQIGLLEKVDR